MAAEDGSGLCENCEQVLGDYVFRKDIALSEGSYGKVYSGIHRNANVALKIEKREGSLEFAELAVESAIISALVRRYPEEFDYIIGLDIVMSKPGDCGALAHSLLLMKEANGTLDSLYKAVTFKSMPRMYVRDLLRAYDALSGVLGYMHKHLGVFHGDFKSANILYTYTNGPLPARLVLTDFGMSGFFIDKESGDFENPVARDAYDEHVAEILNTEPKSEYDGVACLAHLSDENIMFALRSNQHTASRWLGFWYYMAQTKPNLWNERFPDVSPNGLIVQKEKISLADSDALVAWNTSIANVIFRARPNAFHGEKPDPNGLFTEIQMCAMQDIMMFYHTRDSIFSDQTTIETSEDTYTEMFGIVAGEMTGT